MAELREGHREDIEANSDLLTPQQTIEQLRDQCTVVLESMSGPRVYTEIGMEYPPMTPREALAVLRPAMDAVVARCGSDE